MTSALALTDAQLSALRYLTRNGGMGPWRGGSLVRMYDQRARELAEREGYQHHPGVGRRHAWRQNGGVVLSRLEAAGAVRRSGWEHGVPLYVLTEAGRAYLEALVPPT